MPLTVREILQARSDKKLLAKLGDELERHLPVNLHNKLGALVARMRKLSPGFRAMAATFKLDMSMALDDLGWHFWNFHRKDYCKETSRGLWELEADEAARAFDKAFAIAQRHWEKLGNRNFMHQHYTDSSLEKAFLPLDSILDTVRERCGPLGLYKYWVDYARKYPERVVK